MKRHLTAALLLCLAACAFGGNTPVSPASTVVPILIYHSVREYIPQDSATARQYIITPETLESELRFLKEKGFVSIGFDELEANIRHGTPLPEPSVIISFDDGWETQYTTALPLLRKYGFKATFYIFTNAVGRKHFMSLDQLKELLKEGMWIGSHSVSHPYLSKITDPAELRKEIIESKRILEADLGLPVTSFAYPFGQYTPRVVDLVKQAGYTSARGTYFGLRHSTADLFTLTGLIDVTAVAKIDVNLLTALGEEEAARPELPPPGIDPVEYFDPLP
jgi:peptidoglycan/xylan/chitin deacetylase (PgdA/CDA1 family)